MSVTDGNRESLEAIGSRAEELAALGEEGPYTAEAELLAALADGVLSLEDIDDDTLERWVQALGMDVVIGAFMSGARQSTEVDRSIPPTPLVEGVMRAQDTDMPTLHLVAKSSWWHRRSLWIGGAASMAIAAAIVLLVLLPWNGLLDRPGTATNLALQWPSQPPFDPGALPTWGLQHPPLPSGMPDFGKSIGTLGAGGDDRVARWRLATVIVRSGTGWGSGAFISADGWLLTNYHVVADTAQQAAAGGTAATLDVVTAGLVEGRIKPQAPLKATLYRADPALDLALLKLDALPSDRKQMPFFPMGSKADAGEECFVIGSQHNGPAWWVRSGNVSQQFDFPNDLSQFAAGAASTGSSIDRNRFTVTVTDARVSPGDSGGPLLSAKGDLIGLTVATSANASGGSVGWHIAVQHLRSFVADLPSQPEGVPFDTWTGGLPRAAMLEPELADGDRDGHIDSLRYRYAARPREASSRAAPQAVALTMFVDFSQRGARGNDLLDRVPLGLWGMENRGRFRFDLLLISRADGVTAVGYTDAEGVVDEIRIGQSRQDAASVVWRRESKGKWHATRSSAATPLIDSARVGPRNLARLQSITGQIVTGPGEHRSLEKPEPRPEDGSRHGPNRM